MLWGNGATRQSTRRLRHLLAPLARGVAALVLVVLVGFALSGCKTPEQRYRTLSFFFDGVPPPPGMDIPPEKVDPWAPFAAETAQARAQAQAQQVQAVQYASVHLPYQQRDCFKCHSGGNSSFRVSVADIEPCTSCHADYQSPAQGDWMHGPLAVADCKMCHLWHNSEQPALLNKPQEELCFYCHEPDNVLSKPYHATASDGTDRCGACHDPHMAGNRLLLVDSKTYKHRQIAGKEPVSIHQPFKDQQCGECHELTQSNRVKDDINEACRKCHADTIEHAAPTAHQPIRDGQCVSCHSPHESARPHLVRVTAEEMCYSCHKPEELKTKDHPPVERADCLLCHAGHESPRPDLLRPMIPGPDGLPVTAAPDDPARPVRSPSLTALATPDTDRRPEP